MKGRTVAFGSAKGAMTLDLRGPIRQRDLVHLAPHLGDSPRDSFHACSCSAGLRELNEKVRFHRAVVTWFGCGEVVLRPVRRTLLAEG